MRRKAQVWILCLTRSAAKGLRRILSTSPPLGLLVSYGMLGGPVDPDALTAMSRRRADSLALRNFSMHVFDHLPDRRRAATRELIQLLRDGKIKPAIHARLPLAEAAKAHTLLEGREVLGKIILKPTARTEA